MLMFRFWTSDPRGGDKAALADQSMHDFDEPAQSLVPAATVACSTLPAKRRRLSSCATASSEGSSRPATSRPAPSDDEARPRKKLAIGPMQEKRSALLPPSRIDEHERAKDTIEQQFSHAILLKHNELRLISQELAKCQVALEQLRRCHLMPYPVNIPTPQDMLSISSGSGPALQPRSGDSMPQWASPFGVTDGPYARHYAKWLIPDPRFDGLSLDMSAQTETSRHRNFVEGRSTRNSFAEHGAVHAKGRSGRGLVSQKLHALSAGYPQPKDKVGPCVLKRADGKTVKLVCLDCKRENFSSTQGFINHCRIAHKRDFKSHEEAAVACGHPIEVEESGAAATVQEQTTTPASSIPLTSSLGLAHPFTRENALTEFEACFSVVARINESLELYRKAHLPGTTSAPGPSGDAVAARSPATFTPSVDSPHLSRLLQSRGKSMNLGELVSDAKTKTSLDDIASANEESSDEGDSNDQSSASLVPRMRIPARTTMSPVPLPPIAATATTRPTSSKSRILSAAYVTPIPTPGARSDLEQEPELAIEDEMDIDMSPNTAISNNAPSLVSDDGEYDDSVDGSSDESEVDDSLNAESVSDVAEIAFEDDHVGPRTIRHHRGSSGAVENKHVTFVSPVKDDGTRGRARVRRAK